MRSIQEERYRMAMAIFHFDPVASYKDAILRHQKAIKRLRMLIRELEKRRVEK